MNDGEALRRAILALPEDDTPRLIFADWLQENNQPERAEFIRAQVEAVRAEPFSPQARAAAATAEKLLEGRRGEWTRHIRERVERWEFRRGFIEHVVVDPDRFPAAAEQLFAAEPVRSLQVERFVSMGTPPSLAPFFNTVQLQHLASLDLSQLGQPADHFDLLSACPHFGKLTDLNLSENAVPPSWLRTLLTGPSLPALMGLDLSHAAHLGPSLANMLPQVTHRRFTRLNLGHIMFSSDQIKKVLESQCVQEVEELRLAWIIGSGRPGPLTHLNLGWVLPWERLRLLDLTGQGVSNSGVREIVDEAARRPGTFPLRWLGLANNDIGPDSVRTLIDSSLTLFYLDVRNNFDLSLSDKAALQRRFPEAVVVS
ncbi:MAG: TIGR02996 domain-containing protein [Planctomycetia bacterium]|nr:TIGR02996 domain-containing protein [Planctomycetia bacterium]